DWCVGTGGQAPGNARRGSSWGPPARVARRLAARLRAGRRLRAGDPRPCPAGPGRVASRRRGRRAGPRGAGRPDGPRRRASPQPRLRL
ncbi:MAG: hypothetical protein AVDCRST_MAG48-2221, partial [uncultured Friedmanniella sp.]